MVKVLGLLRVKNEERFIADVIKNAPFCERILLFDDHSTDCTVEIASQFRNVDIIRSPFIEVPNWVEEGRDRTFHAMCARSYNPEWIAQINGDEIFEPETQAKIEPFLNGATDLIETHCLTYWDNEETLRVDGHYSTSYRQTFWRYPSGDLTYGFAHDSLPNAAKHYARTREAQVAFWHYGSIDAERRRLRADLYHAIDPECKVSDWRVGIQGDSGGPAKSENLTGEPFRLQPVEEFLKTHPYSRSQCLIAAKSQS